ncbi:hypothetical protein LIER_11733 [Lithospermum erythrorhizon]|uniref:Uncharacterized protein n=1 Tax=Lithospermum erythrorhizon TaxID=34254 RepID=A0AAV3PT55_LITER
MDDKNLVDLSSFLLFETTDDNSEVLDSSKSSNLSMFSPENDSDAMSCSYDESEKVDVHDVDDHDLVVGFLDQDSTFKERGDHGYYCYVECGKEDEEEGVVDQELKKNGDHKMKQPNIVAEKSTESNVVCIESCEELMRRREQDKLFWKSCLES